MSTRILYDAKSAAGQQVAEFIDAVMVAREKGRRLKAQLDSMVNGDTFGQVETEIGGMAPGDGQPLWAIISTAAGQIDSAQVAELARLDQG